MDPGDVLDLFCDFFVGDPNLFSLRSKDYIVKHNKTSSLVGGFNPSEKYESISTIFPICGKIKVMFQTTNQFLKTKTSNFFFGRSLT